MNMKKANLLYDYLDSQDYYIAPVKKESRSMMNVTFVTGDADLDKKFASEAAKAGLKNLKGHRSVGGMRASIYNAMPYAGVEALVAFMKKFAADNPEADNSDTFKLGMAMALLSALVYSAFSFANVAFLYPDLFTEQMDTVMQQMAPMLDSNTAAEMDRTMQNLPQITFFSNLIYCFLFGTIVSFALSRSIPSRDPFADYKPEDQ